MSVILIKADPTNNIQVSDKFYFCVYKADMTISFYK